MPENIEKNCCRGLKRQNKLLANMIYYLQEAEKIVCRGAQKEKKFAEENFLYPLQENNGLSLTAGIWWEQPWLSTCHIYSMEPC